MVELYREAAKEGGHDPAKLPVSINSHGFIADTAKGAADDAFPAHQLTMSRIGKERGWPPTTRAQFDTGATLEGAYFIGSPQEVIDKILLQHQWFKHQRFLLQVSVGTIEHRKVMRAIELLGTRVKPEIDKALGTHGA